MSDIEDEFPEETELIRQNFEHVQKEIENLIPPNWVPTGKVQPGFLVKLFSYKFKHFRCVSSNGQRISVTISLKGRNSGHHPAAHGDMSESRWDFEIRAVPLGNPNDLPRAHSKSFVEFRDWFFELLSPMPESFNQIKKLEKIPNYSDHKRATGMKLFVQEWVGGEFESISHIIGSIWNHIDQKISLLDDEVDFRGPPDFDVSEFIC
jgi:hypothetical protein